MQLVSHNVPIAPYAQPQSVVTTALATTFTGGNKDGEKMHCTCQYDVRFLGADENTIMPVINEGIMDLTPYLPPELVAALNAWFDTLAPQLLKRLAPKPIVSDDPPQNEAPDLQEKNEQTTES